MEKIESERPKTRFSTKVFFWFFVLFALLAIFILWLGRGGEHDTLNISIAIASVCFSVFFGLLCFVRFIRSRSITGGMFLTTCIASGVFLGTSQLVPMILPPAMAALEGGGGEEGGFVLIVALAQIGLFAMWFGFILYMIYLYVKPVKRIDKYLGKLLEGEEIKKVKIGNARQYKVIEEKIKFLSKKQLRKVEEPPRD